ncbi:uncharacterized protein LAESUDRAFT_464734 [Laetiporus sulphureus 93-53]|uniref:Uncharacterized protein n=1 Tax=Laetiporus sulphureus 93-53 TaxID=1314785 RepID=A0A165G6V0_9APHY|nr:uncharacterized protein LAESUDRAFT_464734 [Laetiporus sulphureus 93-53]KZT09907.1 hypothetical protein LAESUDRAFT_464734 [Laetiporus sulphureus 93-53]
MSTSLAMSNVDDPFDHNSLSSPGPQSIDFSLELEHQLESESVPNSPAHDVRPQSLDTHVLASIVTQLRMSLEEVTKERDSLFEQLSEAHVREENTKEALQSVTDKCVKAESDLTAARNQHEQDQEAISMLRQKLEESRRAIMRMQTESRRMSQVSNLTLDLNRAGSSVMNGPPSSRRASSFQPLTGTPAGRIGHRRISSLSDPGLAGCDEQGQWLYSPPPPSQTATSPSVGGHNRRISGMFNWGSASANASPPSPIPDTPIYTSAEAETLRKELMAVKEQLEETKHELSEAHEANEANEACVRALRTFISENSVGEQNVRGNGRPQPPASAPPSGSGGTSRWGFKLWGSTDASATSTPVATAPPPISTAASAPSPVARKLGGLFSPRSSISSTAAVRPPSAAAPPEPTSAGSDTSSVAESAAEPLSPVSSIPRASVLIHDDGMSFDASLSENSKAIDLTA